MKTAAALAVVEAPALLPSVGGDAGASDAVGGAGGDAASGDGDEAGDFPGESEGDGDGVGVAVGEGDGAGVAGEGTGAVAGAGVGDGGVETGVGAAAVGGVAVGDGAGDCAVQTVARRARRIATLNPAKPIFVFVFFSLLGNLKPMREGERGRVRRERGGDGVYIRRAVAEVGAESNSCNNEEELL